jgi:uncharacterized protein (TIGR02611 family)
MSESGSGVPHDSRGEASGFRRAIEAGRQRLAGLRSRVHGLPAGHHLWRVGIAAVGLLVVVAGVIMLIVPGPGWAVIFLGLGIWATEFLWARRLLQFARGQLGRTTSWCRRQPRWLWVLIGVPCVVVAALVIWLAVT